MKRLIFLLVWFYPYTILAQSGVTFLGEETKGVGPVFQLVDRSRLWSKVKYKVTVHDASDQDFRRSLVSCETPDLLDRGGSHVESATTSYPAGTIRCSVTRVTQGENESYSAEITISFSSPGVFLVKRVFDGIGKETGRHHETPGYWKVTVLPPVPATPFSVDTMYYYGETKSFSFAVQGRDNMALYSHKVFVAEGNQVKETGAAQGSYVQLDSILNKASNVGKTFIVEGYYDHAEFQYMHSLDSKTSDRTHWKFRLNPPSNIECWDNPWADLSDFNNKRQRPILFIDSKENPYNCVFKYVCSTPRGNSTIISSPVISDLTVVSDPKEFLASPGWRITSGSTFEITPNESFIPSLKDKPVTLTIQFRTQFRESRQFVYKAYVR